MCVVTRHPLSNTLHDWNLPVQMQVAITDSGSSIVQACQLLGQKKTYNHNLDMAIHKAFDDRHVECVLHVCRQAITKSVRV